VSVVLSALLLAVVCVLWVRSRLVRDYAFVWLRWPADSKGPRWIKLDGDSGAGQVEVAWRVWTGAERDQLRKRGGVAAVDAYHRSFAEVPGGYARSTPPTAWNALGFKWYSGPTHSSVCLPYWPAALLTAAVPGAWIGAGARRRRRVRAGRCAACGYDLRASPERCPECGRPSRS
jgi:hypothetical protein